MNSANLISKLQNFCRKRNFARAVVGLSGGVDSALTLAIAVSALGNENITGILMPREGVNSDDSTKFALAAAEKFGVKTETVEIGTTITSLENSLPWQSTELANINIAPRIRMAILYHFARSHDAIVLGTSNKSEILLGYGTKFGDFAADVEVIGSLWKTEVWQLARQLDVPEEIIDRPPTAELSAGQTDESELGANYETLDKILQTLEENNFELPGNADELTREIHARVLANRHKTELPPVLGE